MDLLTHTISGIAVGTVAAAFSKHIKPVYILLAGAIGGALPDIDVISLWSNFDRTIGAFFGLPAKGAVIYSAKYWYSHHAFFHSIAAALLFTLLLSLLIKGFRFFRKNKELPFRHYWPLLLAFFFAYVLHLVEDVPTPASTWGGVCLLWPDRTYVGGTGHIWWWNNYDIFLIALSVAVINSCFLLFRKKLNRLLPILCSAVFIAGFTLCIYQINTRKNNYAYSGHTNRFNELEQQSLNEQERILGKQLYKTMRWIDRHIPGNF